MEDGPVVERRAFHALAAGRALPVLGSFCESDESFHADGRLLVEELATHLPGGGVDDCGGAGRNWTGGSGGGLLGLGLRQDAGRDQQRQTNRFAHCVLVIKGSFDALAAASLLRMTSKSTNDCN